MSPETTAAVVIAGIGALLLGMAGLIKAMLFGKLADLKTSIELLRVGQEGHTGKIHAIDVRVTSLEAWRKYQEGA